MAREIEMALNLKGMKKLAEGKTKIILENPNDSKTVYMLFKDDITAGDGLKHDVIKGKALIDWKINKNIFEYLNRVGQKTHYIDSPEQKVVLVRKLERKYNLEVVTRRVAAGSIVKYKGIAEGTRFDPFITQFHYKDDPLHDPMLDKAYIEYLVKEKGATDYVRMRELNEECFLHLEKAFGAFDLQLVDLKLEYGIIDDEVTLIDEISGGSFRLWPYAKKNPDLKQENVLGELNPNGRLDKDTYRMGETFDSVMQRFEEIEKITSKFNTLKL